MTKQLNPEEWLREGTKEYLVNVRARVDALETELEKLGALAANPSKCARESLSRNTHHVLVGFNHDILELGDRYKSLCTSVQSMYDFLARRATPDS